MKALFLVSLAAILISCTTTDTEEEGYLERGFVLSGLEAAEVYLEGIEEEVSPELYYNLAYSYIEAGEYDKAIESAEEALGLYPERLRFDYLILYAYRESGRMYSYEKELERLYQKYPFNDTITEMLLNSYYGAKRERAIPVARALLERSPNNQVAIRVLAEFYPFYKAIMTEKSISTDEWDNGEQTLYDISSVLEDRMLT